MPAKVNIGVRDYSGEISTVGIFLNDVANAVAMQTAVDGITSGVIASRSEISSIVELSGANPADENSQRELAVRIFYTDDVTGSLHFVTVPSPDMAAITLSGDAVTLADGGAMAALVTALETNGQSPAGNAITVTRAQIVGRAI